MAEENKTEDYEYDETPKYFKQTDSKIVHHYYLYKLIEEPVRYVPMIHHLLYAMPNETFVLHINTQGGSLEAGVAILNAIRATQGYVIASLESQAFSLGAIIFLSAHEWMVHDNTMLMFHHYSGETWGKGNEIMAHVKATQTWYVSITEELCIPFLEQSELDKLLEGADLWFHADEIRKRLGKVVTKRKKDAKLLEKKDAKS